jgi:hypothetical protein
VTPRPRRTSGLVNGRYDPMAIALFEKLQARSVALIVLGGPQGDGASMAVRVEAEEREARVSATVAVPARMREIARMLRLMADQVDEDAQTLTKRGGNG